MSFLKSMQAAFRLLCTTICVLRALSAEVQFDQMTISQLEEMQHTIIKDLDQLAVFNLRTGAVGTSGYRSFPQNEAETEDKWVQINFKEKVSIDEIVVVPTLWRYDEEVGYLSDGFPEEFRIVAGTEHKEIVVAEFDASDKLLPRVAPVVVSLSGIQASWVRIVPLKLTKRERDNKYIFQLSEVLVFSGEKNIALHQVVTSSCDVPLNSGIWKPDMIADGSMPYFMDSSRGAEKSAHFQPLDKNPHMTIDLEKKYPISSIHLHPAYQSKSAPPEFNVNEGVPPILIIEGANQADFSDATILLKKKFDDIVHFSPILMWNIKQTSCRYIRITGILFDEKDLASLNYKGSKRIGFTEIEVFAEGKNVAYRKGPVMPAGNENPGLSKLTDGYNFYGNVLPLRTWVNQLARRHDLEKKLALVSSSLETRYAKQQSTLLLFKRLMVALVLLIAAIFFIGKYLRVREAASIRKRFTADLHDHVGASLHAIGILSSHTKDLLDSPDKLSKALDEIEIMTGRASEATRDFCNQQMSKGAHDNLLDDLKRNAGRMIANLNYSFTVTGENFLQKLNLRTRSNFFLFFKECLININRHADATEVKIQIDANRYEVRLKISDNGCGITEGEQGVVPPSLARRARYLGSKIKIETPESGGTCISLKIKTRQIYFLNLIRTER